MHTLVLNRYKIYQATQSEWIDFLCKQVSCKGVYHLVTLNPEMVRQAASNPAVQDVLDAADGYCVDGIGIKWAIQFVLNQRVNCVPGVELAQALLALPTYTVYCVGGTSTVISALAATIQAQPQGAQLVGYHHGYSDQAAWPTLIQEIVLKKPDFVLVGMGFPKQDEFIRCLSQAYTRGVAIGVGGSFDVISGLKKRAPQWICWAGLEWLYRIVKRQQWRRLWSLVVFVGMVLRWRLCR